jgi:plastocyanin
MSKEQNSSYVHHRRLVESPLVWAMVCSIMLAVFIGTTSAQTPPAGAAKTSPVTWTVLVGGEAAIGPQEYGPSGAWQFMRYYPENITINVGDKIEWVLKASEPHTVTFPNPGKMIPSLIIPENNSSQRLLFNPLAILPQGGKSYNGTMLTGSGQLDVEPNFPREYNLTFTKAGTFEYFCGFHNMMKGKVTVQPAGTAYPKNQEQIDLDVAKLIAEDMEAALKAEPTAGNVSTRLGSNGTTIYEVKLGYGDGSVSRMRFAPMNLTIRAGDSVEWNRGDVETPHTVTFLSGGKEPDLVLVEPQQRGPPKFVLNPVAQMPAGGKVYSGKGYFNSGAIWGTMLPLPGPHSYNLTFDTQGTYKYLCIFHDYMGMKGQIIVLPKV